MLSQHHHPHSFFTREKFAPTPLHCCAPICSGLTNRMRMPTHLWRKLSSLCLSCVMPRAHTCLMLPRAHTCLTHTHSHTLTHTLSHTHPHTRTHSHTLSHTPPLTHTHSHTLSLMLPRAHTCLMLPRAHTCHPPRAHTRWLDRIPMCSSVVRLRICSRACRCRPPVGICCAKCCTRPSRLSCPHRDSPDDLKCGR